jgi:hypothetical protein
MQHLITLRFTFCKVFHISLFHEPHKCPTKFALSKSSFERPRFYSPNASINTHSAWDSNTRSEERETEPQPSDLSRQEVVLCFTFHCTNLPPGQLSLCSPPSASLLKESTLHPKLFGHTNTTPNQLRTFARLHPKVIQVVHPKTSSRNSI